MTQIAVMGGGALGMLLSARLRAAGCPAALWTRTAEQADLIAASGITVEDAANATEFIARPDVHPFTETPPGFAGILLLTVKQTAVDTTLLQFLSRTLAADATLVLFQNGAGHMEILAAALPGLRLVAAVTTEGALRTGPRSVRHTGKGETWIGDWPETGAGIEPPLRSGTVELLRRLLNEAGFSVSVSNQIRERVLRKLLINSVINPLTVLWRVSNGELPVTSARRTAMLELFRETAGILRMNGLDGPAEDELWANILAVCESTSDNHSSMLQDVLAGRETEIDALNGAICRMAAASGMAAPWNTATAALVKGILPHGERGI